MSPNADDPTSSASTQNKRESLLSSRAGVGKIYLFKHPHCLPATTLLSMAKLVNSWVTIPSELTGSLPRSAELVEARRTHKDGELTADQLALLQEKDLQTVLFELERTGSLQLTDGELSKPSFLSYSIYELTQYKFSFDEGKVTTITDANGRERSFPLLVNAPFRYGTFAVEYLRTAQKYTTRPLKQAVIAPSALSLVYPDETIDNYSHEEFLNDLIDEAEKDVRQCLDAGADKVQLDFAKSEWSSRMDSSGKLMQKFIDINNRMLDRFSKEEQKKLGVHICSGNPDDSSESSRISYSSVLNDIFQLHLNNFYVQLASAKDPDELLALIAQRIQPHQRVFIGVTDPRDQRAETAEEVRDRVIRAAKYIPINQLGTTDDCGFAPYDDDQSMSREKCYAKIRTRIEGTKLAEELLNQPL